MYKKTDYQGFNHEISDPQKLVAVDFWASWCPACSRMSETLIQIASEMEGKVSVVRVDVDSEPELAEKYGIINVPSLMIFDNGRIINSVSGIVPKEMIKKLLKENKQK